MIGDVRLIQLLIVADDFTGALDTGVQFSKKGIQTMVSTKTYIDFKHFDDNIQVLVIDTESRHLNPKQAYQIVNTIVQRAVEFGIKAIYKKTDSTLRGNIGSELTAVLDAASTKALMFIPAYPKAGRTTMDGLQYIHSVLLQETSFANDLLNPMTESNIAAIISNQSPVKVIVVKSEAISTFKILDKDQAIFVFDAQEEEDLRNIAYRLKEIDGLQLMAGCAGFAAFLSEILELKETEIHTDMDHGNFLVICGSVHELSLQQINYAENHGFLSISLTTRQNVMSGFWETAEGENLIDQIVESIHQNKKFIIKSVNNRVEVNESESFARSQNIKMELLPLLIAENMGQLVKKILDKIEISTLVVFGGDTAVAIMNSIQCYGMLTKMEISPGVALSEVISDSYRFKLISKAGGFGREEILMEIGEYICKGVNRC